MSDECAVCKAAFRVEFCDLRTGIVKAVHTPLSMDWQTILCGFGQGTVNLSTRSVKMSDIWPHLTSVYVLRTAGGDATPREPAVEFAGIIETAQAADSGNTAVGMNALESYLFNRMIRERLVFDQEPQTAIAKRLVDYALANGIPLFARDAGSTRLRDRTYEKWDRKFLGEALTELSEVLDGVEWEMQHTRLPNGGWSSTMVFLDEVGANHNMILKSDREANGYGLDVDAKDHANFIDGLGAGEEAAQLNSHAEDIGIYPRFDAAPAWTDIARQTTLDDSTQGYLEDHKEPFAVPTLAISGLEPDPRLVNLGDTVRAEINYGAVSYRGPARITSLSWNVSDDGIKRGLEVQPLGRASETVLNQTATDPCPEC